MIRRTSNLGTALVLLALSAGGAAQTTPKISRRSEILRVATTRQAPDEFGTADYTVTTIGAVSFTPSSDDNSFYPTYVTDPTNFSRQNHLFNTDIHYFATAAIP